MPGMPDCDCASQRKQNRLSKMLQAAMPFLSPDWHTLADTLLLTLDFTEAFRCFREYGPAYYIKNLRGCSPVMDFDGLLCAVTPFCLENELQMLRMFQQFQQMKKMYEMWNLFSSMMPQDDSFPFGTSSTEKNSSSEGSSFFSAGVDNPLASLLTPEQRSTFELLRSMMQTESASS